MTSEGAVTNLLQLLDAQHVALREGDAAAAARLATAAEEAALSLPRAGADAAELSRAAERARLLAGLTAAARRAAKPTEGYAPDGRPIPGALTHRKGKQL